MPDLPIDITPATVGDVPLVLRFIKALAEYERMTDQVVATEESVRESLFGGRPSAEAAIARVNGDPAGFAVWFYNYSTFLSRPGLYLEDLFVLPECRGRGVGRALLQHLARVAVSRGCGRMEWAVLDWNVDAIGFYRSLGAQLLDDWRRCRLDGDAIPALAARA